MFDAVEAFYRPGTVREALRLLQNGKNRARVVAGGTDLVVEGDRSIRFLIDITHAGLSYIRRRGKACVIGATTTMAALEHSPAIRALAGGILARAAATCGSVQIRNMATLGGNLANGSPAADTATPLLALDAEVVLADARGRRKIPLTAFYSGPRKTKTLIVEVAIPVPPRGGRWSFQKLGRTEERYLSGECGGRPSVGFQGPREMGAHRAGRGGANAHPRRQRGETPGGTQGGSKRPGRSVRRSGARGAAHYRRARFGGIPPRDVPCAGRGGRSKSAPPERGARYENHGSSSHT